MLSYFIKGVFELVEPKCELSRDSSHSTLAIFLKFIWFLIFILGDYGDFKAFSF
jgi:hypothetical protein